MRRIIKQYARILSIFQCCLGVSLMYAVETTRLSSCSFFTNVVTPLTLVSNRPTTASGMLLMWR